MRRLNAVRESKEPLKIVKELDAFPKIDESYVETSARSGGGKTSAIALRRPTVIPWHIVRGLWGTRWLESECGSCLVYKKGPAIILIPTSVVHIGHRHITVLCCSNWKFENNIHIQKVENSYDITRSCDHSSKKGIYREAFFIHLRVKVFCSSILHTINWGTRNSMMRKFDHDQNKSHWVTNKSFGVREHWSYINNY